jgi:two-component system response regulator
VKQLKVILLVEDNEQDELLTLRALKSQGVRYQVFVCRDGAEAIDWLSCAGQHAHRDPTVVPCVVLLDLKLPKMNGHEVLSAIRANPKTRTLPVVILTTSKEETDIAKSYDRGANSYIQKPVDYLEFAEAVKSLGIYWLLLNEAPKPVAQEMVQT